MSVLAKSFALLLFSTCSSDALDGLGGVEDLTLGMNSFPSANDLIDLAGGQIDGHLNLGMGDLGDCGLENL